ncbi:MAG: DNA-3-methyladenine glycosylase [Deltaproteobacteria bacterium]|nr:DNA-3-methyladenine glycosylase [Deltaproteobacteria bacterium]MBI3387585.1 DNA-3-methyladenine glycosylase [Deltaproteobacteria bacterium]
MSASDHSRITTHRSRFTLPQSRLTPHDSRLTRRFFARDAVTVAKALLGAILVHETSDGLTSGRIVEVEAYRGPEDRAAHSYGGRRTPRNEVMYGPAGHAYVYFVYGMHYCCNVVAAAVDVPEAILIRALEPVDGVDLMRARRGCDERTPVAALARGPANLCRAMGIDRAANGADLLAGPLRVVRGRRVPPARIAAAPRVGIDYAGPHARRLWRFYDDASDAVSARPRR